MLVPIGIGDMASIQTVENIGIRNGDEIALVNLTGRGPGVMMHIVKGGTVVPSLIMGTGSRFACTGEASFGSLGSRGLEGP